MLTKVKMETAFRRKREDDCHSVFFSKQHTHTHTLKLMPIQWPPFINRLTKFLTSHPADSHLFGPIKKAFRSGRFVDDDDATETVHDGLQTQTKSTPNFLERQANCVQNWVDYVKKILFCNFRKKNTKYVYKNCGHGLKISRVFFSLQFIYTGCNRRNGPDFGRVFLMLNYTDINQNTYIQSWTVTKIMAIEMCGLLGCWRTVRRSWRHTCPMRTPAQDMVMQTAHVSSDVTR